MRANDVDGALDAFRATGLICVDLLNVDELLWIGQVAGARIDYESALLALENAVKKDAAPEAKGKAWVMLGRLLGEKLNRRDEATALMKRVISELPGTSAATFAQRWLST
jgi:TolA-binding protein